MVFLNVESEFALELLRNVAGRTVKSALERPDQRSKHPLGFRSRPACQRRERRHGQSGVGERWRALLQVALEPAHTNSLQPLRLLLADQDRQLERLGQADPTDLARKSLGDVEIAVL